MCDNTNLSERLTKLMKRLSKVNPVYYCLGLFLFTLLFIAFYHFGGFEFLIYCFYYYPIYLFVGKLFYGAFYVELFTKFLWIVLLSLACYLFARSFFKSRKFSSAAISIVFLAVAIILAKYATSDISSVMDRKYDTTEATLAQVKRSRGKGGFKYLIWTNKRLVMNVYQYKELEKIKKQFEDEGVSMDGFSLKINYLPENKCMLNYEVIKK